jgi:hypothetical protein
MRNQSEKYFPLIEKFKSLPVGSVTVEQYCWQNSINAKTYYYWKKRYEAQHGKGMPAGRHGFLPVAIDDISKTEAKGITVEYADGTRLVLEHDVMPSFLKELLPVFSK